MIQTVDLLDDHEAFLRAIFDSPEDDTPRLVYADFLEENDDSDLANYIRLECTLARLSEETADEGQRAVVNLAYAGLRSNNPPDWPWKGASTSRGFPYRHWEVRNCDVRISVDELLDVGAFRKAIVREHPGYFAANKVTFSGGPIATAEPFEVFFGLRAFTRVIEINLGGAPLQTGLNDDTKTAYIDVRPVITTSGVEALARHSGSQTLTSLVLTNNHLDNDAALALVASPHLVNLRRLVLFEGNWIDGPVWQQLIERFGGDVLG